MRSGFTLIELVVVVLIIGILAAFGVPQYIQSVENSKALDAAAKVTMVGTTNRMFALDHINAGVAQYASGQLLTTPCATEVAAGCPAASPYDGCALVACNYVAAQDWTTMPYQIWSVKPGAACPGGAVGGGAQLVACAWRNPGSCSGSYCGWGYAVDTNGAFYEAGGAPAPVQ